MIKRMNDVTVTNRLLPPFNPFMRAKISQLHTTLQILSLQHLHFSSPVCLVTRAYEDPPAIVSQNPA